MKATDAPAAGDADRFNLPQFRSRVKQMESGWAMTIGDTSTTATDSDVVSGSDGNSCSSPTVAAGYNYLACRKALLHARFEKLRSELKDEEFHRLATEVHTKAMIAVFSCIDALT